MKNRRFYILTLIPLIVMFLFSVTAFGFTSKRNLAVNNFNEVTVGEKNITKNTEAIDINLKIPVIKDLNSTSVIKKINDTFYKDAVNFANPLEKDAKKYLADTKKNKNLHFNKYSAYTTYRVKYNKNNILSIPVRYAQYTGGANGLEVQRGYTYNLKNGKLLPLSKVFQKNFDYKKTIDAEVLRQMKANSGMYFPEAITKFKGIDKDHPYYLEDGNLVIFYGPFDIAPHVAGIPEFKIPFTSLKFSKTLDIK